MESSKQVKLVWTSKNGLESRGYNQYQVDPRIFYRKYQVISTYVDYFVIVSHKQDIIT